MLRIESTGDRVIQLKYYGWSVGLNKEMRPKELIDQQQHMKANKVEESMRGKSRGCFPAEGHSAAWNVEFNLLPITRLSILLPA